MQEEKFRWLGHIMKGDDLEAMRAQNRLNNLLFKFN